MSDINDDRNKKYVEEKDSECLYDTSPIEMEEGLIDRNDDNNEKNDE